MNKNLKAKNETRESISRESGHALFEAREKANNVTTLLNASKNILSDIKNGKFEDDPSSAYKMLERHIKYSLSRSKEVEELLEAENKRRKLSRRLN